VGLVMKKRLLLFDIDGTLVLTRGAGREATKHAMREVFGDAGNIEGHTFGGKTDWSTLLELLTPRGIAPADIERHMPRYAATMGRHLAQVIKDFPVIPCPHADDVVAELRGRADLYFGIVTGNVQPAAPVKLRAGGFDPAWFPIGAHGDEAVERDSLPLLAIQRAQKHYRVEFAPDEVIVIGDTPADVQCARAAGAVAVAVLTGAGSRTDLEASQPDFLFDDLRALAEMV
jgi:phosphoglycolate phosphatase-like HAD superfamily hydrolase